MNDLALAGAGSPARIARHTAALAAVSAAHRLAGTPTNPTASAAVRAAVKRAVRD